LVGKERIHKEEYLLAEIFDTQQTVFKRALQTYLAALE